MAKVQKKKCCSEEGVPQHADHSKELHRINRVAGQLEGVKRMITEREYCPKIITQIQAVRAALRSLEAVLLEKHLGVCVRDALTANDEGEAQVKMDEIMELFRRG